MTETLERPKFLPSYFEAISESCKKRGLRALVPGWIIVSGACGAGASYFIPISFWASDHMDVAAIVYTGVLTLNGLILTLSWNAFSRIYESISSPVFVSYLMAKKKLNGYIVYIGYIHISQLVAILSSAVGLILLLCSVPTVLYDKIAFAFMIATSAYAIKTAASAVTVMHDLIWQKAIFDGHVERHGSPNVLNFGRNNDGD
jgi:hypothetical protein